jgi:hypothetical protein
MMELTTRPWITAGVALVGASMVAATPVVVEAVHKVEMPAVQLTSFDPLTEWIDTLQTAEGNATDIFDHWSAAPFPALQESIANRVGYIEDLIKNPSDISTVLHDLQANLTAVIGNGTPADPGALFGPFLPAGGPTDTLYQSLDNVVVSTGTSIIQATKFDLFTLTQQLVIPTFGQDIQPLLNELLNFSGSPLSGELIGDLGTMLSPILEFNADVTAIGDALFGSTPDLTTAFQDLINMPADITNAFLNGFGEVDLTPLLNDLGITLPSLTFFGAPADITDVNVDLGGLLSPAGSLFDALGLDLDVPALGTIDSSGLAVGPLASMVEFGQSIAEALGWSGVGDPLAGLADAGASAADAGSLATDLSSVWTSLF